MSIRLAASSLALAVAVAAAVPLSSAQSSVPPGAAGKKNPLLKLAEPWPDADALKARRIEAEARPLFQRTDPLEFTLTADFNDDQQGSQSREHDALSRRADGGCVGRRAARHPGQAQRARPLPPYVAQLQ